MQRHHLTDSRLANMGATAIHDAYLTYANTFAAITQRAPRRFAERDWAAGRADARERLALYRQIIDHSEREIRLLLAERLQDKFVWAGMKAVYSSLIEHHDDWELAETFFNSVTRRIFDTVGVDPQIEFVATDFGLPPTPSNIPVYDSYRPTNDLVTAVEQLIRKYGFQASFAGLRRDCGQITARIKEELAARKTFLTQIDMVKQPFFRGMAVYLVGRLVTPTVVIPFVLALLHDDEGIRVDGVLFDESSVSILFSFARSYFHVEAPRPYDVVQFVRSIIPRKRVAEIYISMGYHKHGKTELYRDLLHHLARSDEQFQIAPGQPGMVMTVFLMPDYDMVFKVIKDRFNQPKKTTRQEVIAKYELVFHHDRAGRLVDAQAFEHLQFSRERFAASLLAELEQQASRTVHAEGDAVVVSHCYVERQVTPLDMYLRQVEPPAAEAAVIEYGRAIKDLAATNIFPGDMLLKNFGVTRHGRVVFYDYDELTPLLDCRFRRFPPGHTYDDELAAEPWFYVAENDIFPEEFLRFMGLSPELQAVFEAHHGDLLCLEFWQETQARIESGDLLHIRPYDDETRLGPEPRHDA